MTTDAAATFLPSRGSVAAWVAEIMAKLAVIHADILDLDDRLTHLDRKHRDHTSGGSQ